LESIASDDRGCVVFEAPTRAAATLRDLAAAGGVDRPAAVCRELTKLHEQIVVANLGDLESALADGSIPARGEFVIVVGMAAAGLTGVGADRASAAEGRQHAEDLVLARATVDRLVRDGSARGDAARRVAGETGIPRRQLYGGVDEGGDPAEASEKG
jgi:16S rRNA (cytidine1402-2'-O)-methyltransferase